MREAIRITTVLFLAVTSAVCQDPEQLQIVTKDLPHASLWMDYGANGSRGFRLHAAGGVPPYHWRVINGGLPHGMRLEGDTIAGTPDERGGYFVLEVRDSNNPPAQTQKPVALLVEIPFSADWNRKAQVNGQRIDGTVKVSNRTGRDFDLTFVVLAVNDIGRATAIGYQHFPLKANTRDFSLPFGDNLAPGNYVVNVDLVAEEPVSNKIFRTRLVTPKETILQGP
jgi:hypothetical protein